MPAAQRRCLAVGIVKRRYQTNQQRKNRAQNDGPQTDLLPGFLRTGCCQRVFTGHGMLILGHHFYP